jgi:hypothetical protein
MNLARDRAREINRLEEVLESGIRLSSVATGILGVAGPFTVMVSLERLRRNCARGSAGDDNHFARNRDSPGPCDFGDAFLQPGLASRFHGEVVCGRVCELESAGQ